MAYKFQIGDARLSGSLVQEGGITAAGNLDDSATVSGSAFTVDLGGLSIDGTAVGCTAAELNFNDGATAGTVVASKTVVVDGNKDADGFRNISGSGTINADVGTFSGAVTAGTSFIIGSADMNETDLEKLDGITNGTVAASKAVVVDASKDADGFRNISGSGTAEFDVGTFSGAVTAGTSFIIGSADMNETDLEKLDGITNGTVAANKAVVVDASKDAGDFRNITMAGKLGTATDQEYIDFGTSNQIKLAINDTVEATVTAQGFVVTNGLLVGAGESIDVSSAGALNIGDSDANAITIGSSGITTTIAGNLTVQGTTTTVDSTTINISQSFTFEGPADDHETTLHCGTPTQDLQINLPQFSASAGAATYHLPVLADATTTAAAAVTAAEFALLDGGSTVGTTALASGDGFLHNDNGTMKQTSIDKIADFFAGDGLAVSSGVLAVGVDDTGIEINSDALRLKDNGVTLAKMAGITRGSIIHGDSSGNPAYLAKGAANTVLKSDGTDVSYALIANANIDASAGIALTKLEALSSANIIVGNGSNVAAAVAVSGDIAISNAGLVTIQDDAVEGSMLNDNVISGQTAALASGLADTDEFLVSDGGTLKRMDASVLKDYVAALTVTSGSNSATLAVGFNFFNNHGGAISANIPQSTGLSTGDIVHVKAGPDCSATNSLTLNRVGSDTFDATLTSIVLESPNAQVSFVLVDDTDFRLM